MIKQALELGSESLSKACFVSMRLPEKFYIQETILGGRQSADQGRRRKNFKAPRSGERATEACRASQKVRRS